MKKRYKRDAYYLDDGVLIHGYKDKRGFHPWKNLACGFDTQKIRKKDIGVRLFYSLKSAIEKLKNIKIDGGCIHVGVDNGLYETKMVTMPFGKNKVLSNGKTIEALVDEMFKEAGVESLRETKIITHIFAENGQIKESTEIREYVLSKTF